jgi:hypothetical protein
VKIAAYIAIGVCATVIGLVIAADRQWLPGWLR